MANATIYNAVLKDIIPEGLVLIEDDWEDWTYNAGSWTHNGAIGPYGSSDLYLRFNTTQSGNFTNVVNGTNGVTNNTTNTTFEVLKPDLSVTKVVNTTFTVIGRNVEFTITVINTGDCDLGDVFVVEEYPEGLSYVSYSGSKWTKTDNKFTYNGILKKGEKASFTIVFKTIELGNMTNIIIIAGSNLTENKTNEINITVGNITEDIINKTNTTNNTNGTNGTNNTDIPDDDPEDPVDPIDPN